MQPETPKTETSESLPEPVVPKPFTGKKVLTYFLAFFLVFATVDIIFVYLATSSNPGTVTDEAYEKGLAYNKIIEEAQAQNKLGWKHHLNIKMDIDNKRRVVLRMRKANHGFLSYAGAAIRFFRPVEKGVDFDVTLKETRPGTYLALVEFPEPGIWDAYIAVRKGDNIYRAHERLNIP